MSRTKDYLYDVSARHGYGGELTDEFLARLERGEFRDTLLVIDRFTGETERIHETDPQFRRTINLFSDDAPGGGDDETRLRAGDVLTTTSYLRMMVSGAA